MGSAKSLGGMIGLGLIAAGCSPCRTDIIDEKAISSDGTRIYVKYVHCSALNNTVEFYLDRPGMKPVLTGRGDDLEEFSQTYDPRSRTIIMMTPDPSDIEVRFRRVGVYRIRRSGLR